MRYIVFKYEIYEPVGGAQDLFFMGKTAEEVKEKLEESLKGNGFFDIVNILDVSTGNVYGNYKLDNIHALNPDVESDVKDLIGTIYRDLKSKDK